MRYEIQFSNFIWIDIKNPTAEDGEWLKERFQLHPLVIKELLPPLDHPKIENYGDYLSLVFFYPFFDRKSLCTIPFELDLILGQDFIITNHYQDIVPLKAIFDQCNLYEEIREEFSKNGPSDILYRIIKEILAACFPKLNHTKRNIDETERLIYRGEYQKAVAEISIVRRDIIGFQRIMDPQELVLQNLVRESITFFKKDSIPYFHSLLNTYGQVKNILDTHDKILNSLDSTNQALLNDRTNDIIKVLTIFSVIVFPLTLISSIFSMNTNYLPIVGNSYDFWIVLGIMVGGAFCMLTFFKHKKWI